MNTGCVNLTTTFTDPLPAMLVKTEVLEEDGKLCVLAGEPEVAVKPQVKLELPPNFIPSRVRPKLEARVEGGGLLLRCPKCSITYRSHASMKNHTAVCKAGIARSPGKPGSVRQAKEGISTNEVLAIGIGKG